MSSRSCSIAAAIFALTAFSAFAQAPAPSPESLKLARELVTKSAGDKDATLQQMATPMVGMMQQMGVKQPDRAQALVTEAIMPLLSAHYDDLLTIQAQSYAQVLTLDDMKAAVAFYNTPAGQDLVKAQPQLAQLRLTGMTQWMGSLQPELMTKVQATLKAHGWDKG